MNRFGLSVTVWGEPGEFRLALKTTSPSGIPVYVAHSRETWKTLEDAWGAWEDALESHNVFGERPKIEWDVQLGVFDTRNPQMRGSYVPETVES